jgi:microcompartment protein CcmL/EutN
MIDEAGNQAALQAKINQVKKDLEEAHMIKSAIPSNLGHFVDHEIIGDLHDDLEASIKELEAKKAELESEMKELDEVKAKSSKGTAKKKDKPEAPSHEETDANQVYESRFKKIVKKK